MHVYIYICTYEHMYMYDTVFVIEVLRVEVEVGDAR